MPDSPKNRKANTQRRREFLSSLSQAFDTPPGDQFWFYLGFKHDPNFGKDGHPDADHCVYVGDYGKTQEIVCEQALKEKKECNFDTFKCFMLHNTTAYQVAQWLREQGCPEDKIKPVINSVGQMLVNWTNGQNEAQTTRV